MALSSQRIGESSILSEAIIWGLFPIAAVLSFNSLAPLASLGFSLLFAAGFFAVVLFWKRRWKELMVKEALKDILWATLFLGIIFYAFYFYGLSKTSPGNASIILLMEVFFSYLFFHRWHNHYISTKHILGAALVPLGALIILSHNFQQFKIGDFFILLCAFVAPFGNYFQQRARKSVSSETILFIRTAIGFPIILLLAAFSNTPIFPNAGFKSALPFLIINGIVVFGFSKILWIEGIHRISVTKATAIGSIAPLVTIFSAWVILGQFPTVFQLLAIIPMGIGLILLSVNEKEPGII